MYRIEYGVIRAVYRFISIKDAVKLALMQNVSIQVQEEN